MFSVTIREKSGQVYTFHFDKAEILIGRVKGNDVILPKQNISKRHSLVRVHDDRFIIEDLASTNGTYVNGHRISSPVELTSEDKVYLGDFVMQFNHLDGEKSVADDNELTPSPEEVDDEIRPTKRGSDVMDSVRPVESSAIASDDDEGLEIIEDIEPIEAVAGSAQDELDVSEQEDSLPMLEEDLLAEVAEAKGPADTQAASPPSGVREADAELEAGSEREEPLADRYEALSALYGQACVQLQAHLPGDTLALTDQQWRDVEARVVTFVDSAATSGWLSESLDREVLQRDLIYELVGLGPLESLLDESDVERIEVNGPDQIYVTRVGKRGREAARFSGAAALRMAVNRIVAATGIEAGSNPVRGALPDGTSVLALWPPLCPGGPALVLCKPVTAADTLDALVKKGVVTKKAATTLTKLVAARRSILVCGADASSRRAVLNALLMLVDDNERLVIVDRDRPMFVAHADVVRIDGNAASQQVGALSSVVTGLAADRWILAGCGSSELTALLDDVGDGAVAYLGEAHGYDPDGLQEHVLHSYQLHHPGVAPEIAVSRAALALDVVASLTAGGDKGDVLDKVVEVGLGSSGLQSKSLLGK